jgi:hypothetical protein
MKVKIEKAAIAAKYNSVLQPVGSGSGFVKSEIAVVVVVTPFLRYVEV